MKEYLAQYKDQSTNCDFVTGERISGDFHTPCEFPKELLGPCADPATYLEANQNVCVYIKMNKIYGYLPDIKEKNIQITCGPAVSSLQKRLPKHEPNVFYLRPFIFRILTMP